MMSTVSGFFLGIRFEALTLYLYLECVQVNIVKFVARKGAAVSKLSRNFDFLIQGSTMPLTRRRFFSTSLWSAVAFILASPSAQAQNVRVRTVAGRGRTSVNNPYGIVASADGNLVFCEVDTGLTRSLTLGDGRITYRNDLTFGKS